MKTTGTDFLEESPGNKSNSRRIAWNAFWVGVVFSGLILVTGLVDYLTSEPENKPSLAGIAAASITMFGGIAGSAMAYSFFQKTQETKANPDETLSPDPVN